MNVLDDVVDINTKLVFDLSTPTEMQVNAGLAKFQMRP